MAHYHGVLEDVEAKDYSAAVVGIRARISRVIKGAVLDVRVIEAGRVCSSHRVGSIPTRGVTVAKRHEIDPGKAASSVTFGVLPISHKGIVPEDHAILLDVDLIVKNVVDGVIERAVMDQHRMDRIASRDVNRVALAAAVVGDLDEVQPVDVCVA